MSSNQNTNSRWIAGALLAMLLFVPPSHDALAAAQDSLRLRVNDAITEPGGVVSLVVRTYAPRPISQGQICLVVREETDGVAPVGSASSSRGPVAPQRPLEILLDAKTFSSDDDAISSADLTQSGADQIVMLQFSSASGTVNAVEGALAAITFRATGDLALLDRFTVEIDPLQSWFIDAGGNPVTIEPRAGTMRIRHPDAPMRVEIEGDKLVAGELARIEMATFEPVAISSGQVAFRFNPLLATGPAVVDLDERHGLSVFMVDQSMPGLVLVKFRSADNSFGRVPGTVIMFDIPTNPTIPVGMTFEIGFDPAFTFFLDAGGATIPVDLKRDLVEFR